MPEGPKVPATMQSLRYSYNAYSFLIKQNSIYGKIFKVKFHNMPPVVIVSDANIVREIFTDCNNIMNGGKANELFLEAYLGKYSLLTLDGEKHGKHRNILMPTMSSDHINYYDQIITQSVNKLTELWPQKEEFSLLPYLQEIMLDIIMKIIFGAEEANRLVTCKRYLKQFIKSGTGSFVSILYGVFPEVTRVSSSGMKKTSMQLQEFILEEIRFREENDNGSAKFDVLSLLMRATDDRGRALTDPEIIDELITIIMAGNDTTAAVICWMFYYILSSPTILLKSLSELRSANGDAYLDAVFQETLRMRPMFPLITRMLTEDWQCNEYLIPKGVIVAPCAYLSHIDADYWDEPFSFNPERFIDHTHSPYQYFPFGGGVRHCIGSHFAKLQSRVIVKEILLNYELSIAPKYQARAIRHGLTFVPYKGLPITSNVLVDVKPAQQDKKLD